MSAHQEKRKIDGDPFLCVFFVCVWFAPRYSYCNSPIH